MDGRVLLVTTNVEWALRLIDPATGEPREVDTGPHAVTAVAVGSYRPVAAVAAVARADGTVLVRDLTTGETVRPPVRLPVPATALAFAGADLVVCFGSDVALLTAVSPAAAP